MTNKEKIEKIREIGDACVARLQALHQKQLAIIRAAVKDGEQKKLENIRAKIKG
ncbi:MAG: hypothetical protein Q7S16_04720 [bacterium]|nr:hypothetical protein [bacterium]